MNKETDNQSKSRLLFKRGAIQGEKCYHRETALSIRERESATGVVTYWKCANWKQACKAWVIERANNH